MKVKSTCLMTIDVRMDLISKVYFVSGGHFAAVPVSVTYSSLFASWNNLAGLLHLTKKAQGKGQ